MYRHPTDLSSEGSFKSAKSHEELPLNEAEGEPPRFPSVSTEQQPTPLRVRPYGEPYHLSRTASKSTLGVPQRTNGAYDDDDNWGSIDFSEAEVPTHAHQENRLRFANTVNHGEPSPSISGNGDSLRLRSYVEPSSHRADQLPHALIGIYADPAAKKDDWGDDFYLEDPEAVHPDASCPSPFEPLHEPPWPQQRDSPIMSSQVFSRLNIPRLDLGNSSALPLSVASHQTPSIEEFGGQTAQPYSVTTSSRGAQLPILGYDSSEVHQSCAHLKELFARHDASIQQQVDDVIVELGNLARVDQKALCVLLHAADTDVSRILDDHKGVTSDVLEWKLEFARQTNNFQAAAKSMLGLALYASFNGDIEGSQKWLDDAIETVSSLDVSSVSVALDIEANFESAVNQRQQGKLGSASNILNQCLDQCSKLMEQEDKLDDAVASGQRAIWWSLRCKFLLAEISREQNQLPMAIQLYAEYSVECIARMIGLIAQVDNGAPLSHGLVWYFLFSPRSLVIAIWSCTRCLYELRAFSPAADMAAVSMKAATLFGNKDINDGAAELRVHAKSALREFKRHESVFASSSAATPERPLGFGNPHPSGSYDDFGESDEDWDTSIEKERNIKIERISEKAKFPESGTSNVNCVVAGSGNLSHADENSFISSAGNTSYINTAMRTQTLLNTVHLSSNQCSASTDLMEGELRLYLNRIHSAPAGLSMHQMYPKPTVPFDGLVMRVTEHEAFLRNFVRGKDPRFVKAIRKGLQPGSVWDPNFIDGRERKNPMKVFRSKSKYVGRFSPRWATLVLETVWNILRGDGVVEEKRANLRTLLQATIREANELTARNPILNEDERWERLDILAALLEALRLSREVLTQDGQEAIWFFQACSLLSAMATKVKPAAKAAVELFQAESRAHCGVAAVIPPALIRRSFDGEQGSKSYLKDASVPSGAVLSSLRHSVVDILHALFWRTKSGFDESSSKNSFERLIHADVASSLFLTGCGISPVDGSVIDVIKDESVLRLRGPVSQSEKDDDVIDETRRVSSSELVQELQNLWASLPSSAGPVRAKVSFALAFHSGIEPHDYGTTEQFLFDGLQALHSTTSRAQDPVAFFSTLSKVSPIAVVSSPMSEALLQAYGTLTLEHSKYRYGIAALEAASDCRRVRDLRNLSSMATALDVATAALSKGDWRRALVILYNLRGEIHPKDGKRNDFIHLCLLIHQICMDAGCFAASLVPLRAFSTLIYEESLRVLLLRYRRRLARKSRNRQRFHSAISPLPTVLSKTPYLKAQGSSLAVLFESPLPSPLVNDSRTSSASATTVSNTSANFHFSRNPVVVSRTKRVGDKGNSQRTPVEQADRPDNSTRVKPKAITTVTKKRLRAKPHMFEEEQKELLRIEAEQELIADAERFQVEFLLIKTSYAEGKYSDANCRCQGLLEMKMPHSSKFKIHEVRARIALKRRAITQCLELIDDMEKEFRESISDGASSEPSAGDIMKWEQHSPFSGAPDDSEKMTGGGDHRLLFIPTTTFLRLSALLHGGRLREGMNVADDALKLCPETEIWNKARLHYLRGKILHATSSISTAPFEQDEALLTSSPRQTSTFNAQYITLTLSAFETASRYFDAAGDEIGTLKSDLLWARTCIDTLFRRVVLPADSGGGLKLEEACALGGRTISPSEVEEAIHNVLYLASTANVPLVLIDALAALAEIKCIRGEPAHLWNVWVTQSWRLFSRLLTDSENFTIVLTEGAPVSTLIRIRNICGRLVRLVLVGPKAEDVTALNHHLHMFEAYVTLQVDIDRKMNLTTTAQRKTPEFSPHTSEAGEVNLSQTGSQSSNQAQNNTSSVRSKSSITSDDVQNKSSVLHDRLAAVKRHYGLEKYPDPMGGHSRISRDSIRTNASTRPAGAFLHLLGSEGVELGRLGLSVFINRPRKHVISAVKETGAVLIPSNFFTNSRAQEKAGAHVLGKDAELIFPFSEKLGLGAMQILDGPKKSFTSTTPAIQPIRSRIPGTSGNIQRRHSAEYHGRGDHRNSAADGTQVNGAGDPTISKKRSNRSSDGPRLIGRGERRRGSSFQTAQETERNNSNIGESEGGSASRGALFNGSRLQFGNAFTESELVYLVDSITSADNAGGRPLPPNAFGNTTAERVWAHLHRIKTETKRYVHGVISIEELGNRNREALRSWLVCVPHSNKEWTVPESIAKRLVYVLFAHGVLGYYVVDRGGCISSVGFGGKQIEAETQTAASTLSGTRSGPRPINDSERTYLYNLVEEWKRSSAWYKDRDYGIINGLALSVLKAPRTLLASHAHSRKSKSRPVVLITDSSLQVFPWELFFDHVVIRSLSLLDVIRGVQDDSPPALSPVMVPSNFQSNRDVTRFICFTSSRREGVDTEKNEEARRQHFAFQSLLRLNHLTAPALITRLNLGRFNDSTAVNAVARPTGPLSTPLSQSRKAGKILGVRLQSLIGQRNYPHVDFLKIHALGTASTGDLKESTLGLLARVNEKEGEIRDVGEYITVFLFTYADLIGSSQSIFGLTRAVRKSILMFTPATQMKVLARHLEDDELTRQLDTAHRGLRPDICSCARVLVDYVSRFSREKRIPIVVFLGEGLIDVFPRKRVGFQDSARVPTPAAASLFQRPSRTPTSPFR